MKDDLIKHYEPFFDKWKIKEKIGEGTFGSVYEITDGNQTSALKHIHIEFLQNVLASEDDKKAFVQKAVSDIMTTVEYAEKQDHPNLVKYYEHTKTVENESADILVRMELLEPLRKQISEKGLSETDVHKIGLDICSALEKIHDDGLFHRDIKPSNILCDGDCYKLGDFDTAVLIKDKRPGNQVGTLHTMAPEVKLKNKFKIESDIYSLGMTLYMLLNDMESAKKPVQPGRPRHGSDDFVAVILKACSYRLADRYHSAKEFYAALKGVQVGTEKVLAPRTWEDYATVFSSGPIFESYEKTEPIGNWQGPFDGPTSITMVTLPTAWEKASKKKDLFDANKNLLTWLFFTFVVSVIPLAVYSVCSFFVTGAVLGEAVYKHELVFLAIVFLTAMLKTVLFGKIKETFPVYALIVLIVAVGFLFYSICIFAVIITSETMNAVKLEESLDTVAVTLCLCGFVLGGATEHVEDIS